MRVDPATVSEALFVLDELGGTGRRDTCGRVEDGGERREWGGIGVREPEVVKDDVRRVGREGERALASIYRAHLVFAEGVNESRDVDGLMGGNLLEMTPGR